MNTSSEGLYLTLFQRQLLQENIKKDLPKSYRQRLEIILLTDNGKTQAEICRIIGCCTSTASRWIQLTKAGLAHNYLDCPVGRPKIVTDEYIELLRELLQKSPRDYGYPFRTWTVSWLGKHITKTMGIEVSESHLKRVMRDLGLSTRLPKTDLRSSQSQSQKCSEVGASIFIADLPHVSDLPRPAVGDDHRSISADRSENELSESNLRQIITEHQIYGSASSFTTYFFPAARRDFSYFPYACRV
jgi:transposase